MNTDILHWFRCPFCVAEIHLGKIIKGSEQKIQHGLLHCPGCGFEFPVISGVAILLGPDDYVDVKSETTASTLLTGPRIRDLVQLLKDGEAMRALSLLLGPTGAKGELFPELKVPRGDGEGAGGPRKVNSKPAGRDIRIRGIGRIQRLTRSLYRSQFLPRAQLRLAQFLETHGASLSALDVINLYYGQYSGVETSNYFAYRFGQPRHLAGLSLASLMGDAKGPILDLACGVGHFTHFFAYGNPGRPVVGLDRDFFRLFVASQYTAPEGNYVCTPADTALPFSEKVFAGIFCSDAFHYFLHRAASIRELQRLLSDEGTLALCRFGNSEVEPREGYELSLDGYRRLLGGWPHVFMGEDDLVNRYLKKQGADLTTEAPAEALRRQKWLSVVSSRSPGKFGNNKHFADWPHAVGRLQINPIFVGGKAKQNGSRQLRFEFPSKWYEFENQRYRDYAPEHCTLPPEVMQALNEGKRPPEVEDYLNQFVILGMPERYCERGVDARLESDNTDRQT